MIPQRSMWGKDHILAESAFSDHETHAGHGKLGHFSLLASIEACQIVLPTITLPALQAARGRMMVGRMIDTLYREKSSGANTRYWKGLCHMGADQTDPIEIPRNILGQKCKETDLAIVREIVQPKRLFRDARLP